MWILIISLTGISVPPQLVLCYFLLQKTYFTFVCLVVVFFIYISFISLMRQIG